MWSATALDHRRFPAAGMHTSQLDELRARIEALRADGAGYLQVMRPGSYFPALLVAFGGEHAVVHFQEDDEQGTPMYQFYGDGSVPSDEAAEVYILDGLMPFPGECVMALELALEIMEEFVRTGAVGDHPRWAM
jgi:hypothetical protein